LLPAREDQPIMLRPLGQRVYADHRSLGDRNIQRGAGKVAGAVSNGKRRNHRAKVLLGSAEGGGGVGGEILAPTASGIALDAAKLIETLNPPCSKTTMP
jgi:hypothetical protein